MHTPYFTYFIITLTVIITILGFTRRSLFEKGIFSTDAIFRRRELYRLLTSLLLHVNIAHLLFNMYSYYSFGAYIEEIFGPVLAAALYILSALGGGAVALLINRKKPGYTATGASGAVCGVIFASIFLLPGGSVYLFFIPVPIPSWLYAIAFMAISLYGIGRTGSMIGHEAHAGGALAGMILAVIYRPSILYTQTLLFLVLLIPSAGLLFYFIKVRKNRSL